MDSSLISSHLNATKQWLDIVLEKISFPVQIFDIKTMNKNQYGYSNIIIIESIWIVACAEYGKLINFLFVSKQLEIIALKMSSLFAYWLINSCEQLTGLWAIYLIFWDVSTNRPGEWTISIEKHLDKSSFLRGLHFYPLKKLFNLKATSLKQSNYSPKLAHLPPKER